VSATSRLVLVLALCVITSLLSPQSTRLVAVRTGQMFDAKAGRLVPDQVVLVSGDRIVEVGRRRAWQSRPTCHAVREGEIRDEGRRDREERFTVNLRGSPSCSDIFGADHSRIAFTTTK